MVIAECSVKETGTGTPRREHSSRGEGQSGGAEVGIEATCSGHSEWPKPGLPGRRRPRSRAATRARQDAAGGSFSRLESRVWSVTSLRRGWGGYCDDAVPADGSLSSRWPEGRW